MTLPTTPDGCDRETVRNKYRALLAPQPPNPNEGITDVEIGEILGIPTERAMRACERGGLRPTIRGFGHPKNECCNAAMTTVYGPNGMSCQAPAQHTCDAEATRLRYFRGDVQALKVKWDAGETSELMSLDEVSVMLSIPPAVCKRLLIESGAVPVMVNRAKYWPRHLAEKVAVNRPQGVTVQDVASKLGVSVSKARQIVAVWPTVGEQYAGPGPGRPQTLYDPEYLERALANPPRRQASRQDVTHQVRALRSEKYAREQELYAEFAGRMEDLRRERTSAIVDMRAEYDERIRALLDGAKDDD